MVKYIIKVPIDPEAENIEYKETIKTSKKAVLDFLSITSGQFTRILNGTLQCKHFTNSKLKGIKIERVDNINDTPLSLEKRTENDKKYRDELLKKIEEEKK